MKWAMAAWCAVLLAALPLAGCGSRKPSEPRAEDAATATSPAAPNGNPPGGGMSVQRVMQGSGAPDAQVAGYLFGVPVPAGNYYFAKRVSYMFPRPWEEQLQGAERERAIWEALILHYESFRQGVTVSDEELERRIASVLRGQQLEFTRGGDPAAYTAWVRETLGEDVELFENQMRYLLQIDKLKERMRTSFTVAVTDEEMQQEFLNEQHHVGGEMVTFDTLEAAQTFYGEVNDPVRWERMKARGEPPVRPVSLMTLEAYMDLWSIPKDQMYAFHAMELGSIGPPMPFGRQWCVYRLLDKRTGDLAAFSAARDAYLKQLTAKKQYERLKEWTEELKRSANLTVLPLAEPSTP